MASSQDETGASDPLGRVLETVRFLRRNCPWDAAQTPRSLLPYLLEEAHEVAAHVEDEDEDALRAELGDLLLHVAFQIVLAEERRAFDSSAVAEAVIDKMRRRHPHLYGLGEQRDWEELKAEERAAARSKAVETPPRNDGVPAPAASLLQGLPRTMEPLALAHRVQDRVAAVGFDWEDWRGAFEKVREEVEEVAELAGAQPSAKDRLEEEIGDLLFAVVNFARLTGVHAALALRAANRKFTRRFEALEHLAAARNVVLGQATLADLDALWDEIKKEE